MGWGMKSRAEGGELLRCKDRFDCCWWQQGAVGLLEAWKRGNRLRERAYKDRFDCCWWASSNGSTEERKGTKGVAIKIQDLVVITHRFAYHTIHFHSYTRGGAADFVVGSVFWAHQVQARQTRRVTADDAPPIDLASYLPVPPVTW